MLRLRRAAAAARDALRATAAAAGDAGAQAAGASLTQAARTHAAHRAPPARGLRGGSPSFAASAAFDAAEEKARMEEVNALFVEARDAMEDARDSMETVYFNEEFKDAKALVHEALGAWEALLQGLPSDRKDSLVRSNGLKMEQLRAELTDLEEALLEDDH